MEVAVFSGHIWTEYQLRHFYANALFLGGGERENYQEKGERDELKREIEVASFSSVSYLFNKNQSPAPL